MGRPTKFSQELADLICKRLADGMTLRQMCRDFDDMPVERGTISDWIATNQAFSDQVACAREAGSHALIEDTRDIADDGTNDYMARHGQDAIGYQVNGEAVARSKLRIEQRWREAEAILPKVYGKRQTIEHAGTIGVVLSEVSDEDLAARMLELVTTGRLKLPAGAELVELDEDDDAERVTDTPTPDDDDPW